jgi:NhaP-type Na+/H+ or K+/H+ antiporter
VRNQKNSTPLALVLAFAFVSAQVMGQVSKESHLRFKSSFVGGTLTCSQSPTIHVPLPLVERARIKARLRTLLRESLDDDGSGIANVAREKEIRKLANELTRNRD